MALWAIPALSVPSSSTTKGPGAQHNSVSQFFFHFTFSNLLCFHSELYLFREDHSIQRGVVPNTHDFQSCSAPVSTAFPVPTG